MKKNIVEQVAALAAALETCESNCVLARQRHSSLADEAASLERDYSGAPEGQREKLLPALRGARDRLELQPAVIARLERERDDDAAELSGFITEGLAGIKPSARAWLEELRSQFGQLLLPVVGGDKVRLKPVLDALLAASEAERWRRFGPSALTGTLAERAHRLPALLDALKRRAALSAAARFGSSTP